MIHYSPRSESVRFFKPMRRKRPKYSVLKSSRLLHNPTAESHNYAMTEKEIVLETIRSLPDDCSLDEIAERIEFMAAVQKGLDQLDRGEGIPHDEIKKQLASWLTN
jgi:hypothetical protein